MSKQLPMKLPECPAGHGQMHIRTRQSKESSWCGTWYDCVQCHSSVLFQSRELKAHLASYRHD